MGYCGRSIALVSLVVRNLGAQQLTDYLRQDEFCSNFTIQLLDDGSAVVQPSAGLWEIAIVVGSFLFEQVSS